MDAAAGDRHHLVQRGPVLLEEQALLKLHRRVGVEQRVVEAANHLRVALELADHGAGVDVIDPRHPHPLADHTEVHAVIFLPRVGAVAGAMQVKNHVVLARPDGHALDRGVADHQVDHDDHAAQALGELGPRIHLLHRAGGHVEIVALDLAAGGAGLVDCLHAIQKAIAPMHEGLRVDVLVVLHEVEAALQALIDHAAVVAPRQTQLGLGGGAQQRPAELVEPLALDHDSGGRALEGLEVGHRDPHVFQAQGLDRLEAEHVADDRRGEVGNGAALEQVEVVGDVGEILLLGLGADAGVGHRVDAVGLGAVQVAGGQAVGPDHRPGRGRRLAGHGGRALLGVHALLRRDAEHRDDIGVLGHVVGLPVAHLLVSQHAGRVALFAVRDHRVVDRLAHRSSPDLEVGCREVRATARSGKVRFTVNSV